MGYIYIGLTIVVAWLGWVSRDREYRVVAWTLFIGSRLSWMLYTASGETWIGLNEGVIAIDAVATILFGYIAFTSRRYWPLWVTPLQFGALLSHFSSNLASGMVSYAAGMMQGFWAWLQLAILVIVAIQSGYGRISVRRPEAK